MGTLREAWSISPAELDCGAGDQVNLECSLGSDGAREPSWASSFPSSVVVELIGCDLMNPSGVFKE